MRLNRLGGPGGRGQGQGLGEKGGFIQDAPLRLNPCANLKYTIYIRCEHKGRGRGRPGRDMVRRRTKGRTRKNERAAERYDKKDEPH